MIVPRPPTPADRRASKRRLHLAALFLGAILSLPAAAGLPTYRSDPDYLIDAWETEDGLPANSATAMVQAPDGYLWFGTFGGLARFDGVKFTTFNAATTPELVDDGIANLHLDRSGRLWVSTFGGLARRDGGQWKSIGTNDGWPPGQIVRTFAERANGDVLFTGFDGLVLEHRNGRITQLPSPPGLPGKGYIGHVDEDGRWWVVQPGFIGKWDGEHWISTLSPAPVDGSNQLEVGAGPARDGGLWLQNGRLLRKFSRGHEVLRHPLPETPQGYWSIHEDSRTNVWITSYSHGLYRISPDGGFRHWTSTNGLTHNGTRFVFEDREQNLWVGSGAGGLMRFKPRRFKSFDSGIGISERVVKSVSADASGNLWVGTYGAGVFKLTGNRATHVPLESAGLGPALIQSVLVDRQQRVWVGTFGNGAILVDGERRVPIAPERSGGDNVIALFEDSRGRVWAAGGKGLGIINTEEPHVFGPDQGLPPGGIRSIAEDSEGAIWVTNLQGVFRLRNGRFEEVRDAKKAPLARITSLYAETGGSVWMGSLDEGLLRWKDNSLVKLDATEGLPVRAIHGMIEDGRGWMWLASNRGIVRIAKTALQTVVDGRSLRLDCQLFDLDDGLPSVECAAGQQPVCARDSAGNLWFATAKGVGSVNASQIRAQVDPPSIEIEEIVYRRPGTGPGRKQRGTLEPDPEVVVRIAAPFETPLQLPAGSHLLEFRYNALEFSAPAKLRFETRLNSEGAFDGTWNNNGSRRFALFYDLSPGEKTFQVRAANGDGVWNLAGKTLPFSVAPYYWQTGLFRLGMALLFLCAGGGIVGTVVRFRLRLALERERAGREIEVSRKRMEIAAEAAQLGFWEWDLGKSALWASRKCLELLRIESSRSLTYEGFRAKIHPDDRQRTDLIIRRALAEGGRYEVQFRVPLSDGSVRWIVSTGRVEPANPPDSARLVGVCVDITERRRAQDVARELSGRLINAQEEERRRLARELHDDLSQRLALLCVELEMMGNSSPGGMSGNQHLESMARQVRELSTDVHRLAYQLHPSKLDQLGLVAATRGFCRDFARQSGMQVNTVLGDLPPDLPPDVSLCFYRIIQESLQNALRHSQAREINVRLEVEDRCLVLEVGDDGCGFDVEKARLQGGLGLLSMGERVRQVGGHLSLRSRPREGTHLDVRVPLGTPVDPV